MVETGRDSGVKPDVTLGPQEANGSCGQTNARGGFGVGGPKRKGMFANFNRNGPWNMF